MSSIADIGTVAVPSRRRKNRPLWLGTAGLAIIVVAAILAPVIAPADPTAVDLTNNHAPPSPTHLMGTDAIGRDVFSRVVHGARISLTVACLGMLGSLTLGTAMGLLGAFARPASRWAVDRLIDVQLAFPYVLLAIAITSAVDPSIPILILLMVLAGWAAVARVVRSIALQQRSMDYVRAAVIIGASSLRIASRHVMPSIIPSLRALAAMQMAAMIVFEATLSFLGMGVQPPTPSWGGIMLEGKNYMTSSWWLTTLPGFAIVSTSLCLVLIGDGLQGRASAAGERTESGR